MKQDKNVTPAGVSRRTIVKGAAWAVPAITVASAVPAVASSAPIEIEGVLRSCKHSGQGSGNLYPKGYHIEFTFKNTSNEEVTFTLPGLVLIAGAPATSNPNCVPQQGNQVAKEGEQLTVVVAPNTTETWVVHYYSSNSANGLIIFDYDYSSTSYSATLPASFQLSGDSCSSTPIGIPDNHACSTTSTPKCVVSPTGPCPT